MASPLIVTAVVAMAMAAKAATMPAQKNTILKTYMYLLVKKLALEASAVAKAMATMPAWKM